MARRRPVHTRTAVFGLLLVALGVLIGIATDLTSGVALTDLHPALPVLLVVPVVVAWLVWRFGTWSKILAAVGGVTLVALNIPFLVEALPRPASPLEFLAAASYLAGGALAAFGGVAAVVGDRRPTTQKTSAERRIQWTTLGGLAVLAAVAGVVTVTTTSEVDDEARAGALEVPVADHRFADDTITVPADEASTLAVRNRDTGYHTFTIEELDIDVALLPGDEVLVELPPLAPGEYTIICVPHPEMVGTLEAR